MDGTGLRRRKLQDEKPRLRPPRPKEPPRPKPKEPKSKEPEKPKQPEPPRPKEPEKPEQPTKQKFFTCEALMLTKPRLRPPRPKELEKPKPKEPEKPKPKEPEKPKPKEPKPKEPEKPKQPEPPRPKEPEKPKPKEPEKPKQPEKPEQPTKQKFFTCEALTLTPTKEEPQALVERRGAALLAAVGIQGVEQMSQLSAVSSSAPHQKTIEWVLLITTLLLEATSAIFEQLDHALMGMVLAFIALILSIIDLILEARKEGSTGDRSSCLPTFFRPSSHNSPNRKPFGSLIEHYGLAGAVWQCISSTIKYHCARHNSDNPIKVCLLPFIFAACVVISKLRAAHMNYNLEP